MLCFVSFCFVGLPEIRVFCHKIYVDVQHGCNAFSKIFRTPWLSSVQFKGSQGIPFFLQERSEKQQRISKVIYCHVQQRVMREMYRIPISLYQL